MPGIIAKAFVAISISCFLTSSLDAGADAPAAKAPMFEDTASSHRIAFVLSASGGMIPKLEAVKAQLSDTIFGLTRTQSFNLIFFQDGKFMPLARDLIPASDNVKKKLKDYLEGISASGKNDVLPALEPAFRQSPEVIYLLVGSEFPDDNAVVEKIRALNKDKKVKVYTIACDFGDAQDDTIKALQRIAKENNGKYKEISEKDL